MHTGDLVQLDKDFNNSSIVKLVSLDKIYSLVKDIKTGKLHEVMTNRLSDIDNP